MDFVPTHFSSECPQSVWTLQQFAAGKLPHLKEYVAYRGDLPADIKRCEFSKERPQSGEAPVYRHILRMLKAALEHLEKEKRIVLEKVLTHRCSKHAQNVPFYEYVVTRPGVKKDATIQKELA